MLKEYRLSVRFTVDAMHVLLVREYRLVIVSYELLANILGVACKRPLGNLVACNIYPSKAVERAVKEVRRIRDRIGVLVELGEKAREKGRGDEADKILDAFFEGVIGYQEAYTALKKLAN